MKRLARERSELFDLSEILATAVSLEPVDGSEYWRGICELIGRLRLDFGARGDDTVANAAEIAALLRENQS